MMHQLSPPWIKTIHLLTAYPTSHGKGQMSEWHCQTQHFLTCVCVWSLWHVVSGHSINENEADKFETSLFGKIEKRYDKWEILADAQIRYIDYKYEGLNTSNDLAQLSKDYMFFNPKVGLSYYLTGNSNFYIYGGIAHKEPNRDDFTDAAPGKIPNPERRINSELGYRYNSQTFQFTFNQ